jgi:hypothetical protein
MFGILGRILRLPFYILFGARAAQEHVLPTLILTDYQFNPQARGANESIMQFTARQPGFIARIMRLLGLGTTSSLKVTPKELMVNVSQLSGQMNYVFPLSTLTTSDFSVEKPVGRLRLGLILGGIAAAALLIGLIPVTGVLGAIAALLIFTYLRGSRLVIAFSTTEISDRYGLAFRRSGKARSFDLDTMLKLVQVVNRSIVSAHS